MIDRGLLFTYITARDWISSSEIMKAVKLELPVAVCNGSAIINFKNSQVLKGYYIEQNIIYKINEIARKHVQIPRLTVSHKNTIEKYRDNLQHEGDVISLAFVDKTERILKFYKELNEEIGATSKLNLYCDPFDKTIRIIDIVSSKASKGAAALDIAEFCGGIHTDNIISFGNDNNDTELLKISGLGIGVGNATGEWREYADIHLEYENGYSVLKFIEQHFKK